MSKKGCGQGKQKVRPLKLCRVSQTSYKVDDLILDVGVHPAPSRGEITAVALVMMFLGKDAKFIQASAQKTPDVMIGGLRWEIKQPLGGGKHTIEHQIHRAGHQAGNMIFDARRIKISSMKIVRQILFRWKAAPNVKRIILIDKAERVTELCRSR